MTGKEIFCILTAYLVGGICFGYLLVRIRTGEDIREHGSGGVGATNAGRLLGPAGFVCTLLGDSVKGLAAILLAGWCGAGDLALSLAFIAVIAGHVWPLLLRFRGGRGVATAIGAYAGYDPHLLAVLFGSTAIFMLFRRGLVVGGLVGFLMLPLVAWLFHRPGHRVAAFTAATLIILFAHRRHLYRVFGSISQNKET